MTKPFSIGISKGSLFKVVIPLEQEKVGKAFTENTSMMNSIQISDMIKEECSHVQTLAQTKMEANSSSLTKNKPI